VYARCFDRSSHDFAGGCSQSANKLSHTLGEYITPGSGRSCAQMTLI
jgi:hypothetical protein